MAVGPTLAEAPSLQMRQFADLTESFAFSPCPTFLLGVPVKYVSPPGLLLSQTYLGALR